MTSIAKILRPLTGDSVPMVCWTKSSTGTLANRCCEMVSSDDLMDILDGVDIKIVDVAAEEAEAVAQEAHGNSRILHEPNYSGYEWLVIEVDEPHMLTRYYVPKGGW